MPGEIRIEREGPIAFATLSHPGRLNAMSRAMWTALRTAFERFASDATLRCIVLRGEGAAFCAGGDISEYPGFRFDPAQLRAFHEDEVGAALQAMLDCEVPVVAQIEGACLGAGLEMASCCDLRLAGTSATFGAPIAKLGFPMAPREAAIVHRAVGDLLARDMLLAAGVHDAQRLREAGFLLRVLADAEVADEAAALARRVAALAPEAARANKRVLAALARSVASPLAALLPSAYDYADSPEHREGIDAFLAKRTPDFRDPR